MRDFQSALTADTARTAAFFRGMLARGVYPPPSQFEAWFLSGAHTDDATWTKTIKAARAALMAALPIDLPDRRAAVSSRTRRIVPAGSVDVLAFGRRDRAAAADQHAEQRALHAAEDAADDRADAGAGADLAGFTLDAFALERLRSRCRGSDSCGRGP